MKFNTIEFLNDYGISVIESHGILTSDYVGLSTCPFCGAQGNGKPYFAMRRDSSGCNCWICHETDFYKAVQLLTGISDYNQLKIIYKKYGTSSAYSPKYSDKEKIIRPTKIEIPGSKIMTAPARKYLKSRDFNPEYLWEKYDLKVTTYLKPDYRIVLPIKYNNRDVSYTARDYTKQQESKYMSCEKALEIIPHKEIFYGIDFAKGPNVLWLEGPTDQWRVGDGSIASFGTEYTLPQIMLLCQRFENIFIMFDGGESEAARHAKEAGSIIQAVGRNCEILELEEGSDPDEIFKDVDELVYMKKDLKLY